MSIETREWETPEARWTLHGPGIAFPEEREEEALTLLKAAVTASKRAYAPYSKFHVGAALSAVNQSGKSRTFHGCNIENASYGATMCAERVAIFSAVSAGFPGIDLLALSTRDSVNAVDLNYRSPCGICRQVMSEFSEAATLILIDGGTDENGLVCADVMTIDTVLPWRFSL